MRIKLKKYISRSYLIAKQNSTTTTYFYVGFIHMQWLHTLLLNHNFYFRMDLCYSVHRIINSAYVYKFKITKFD